MPCAVCTNVLDIEIAHPRGYVVGRQGAAHARSYWSCHKAVTKLLLCKHAQHTRPHNALQLTGRAWSVSLGTGVGTRLVQAELEVAHLHLHGARHGLLHLGRQPGHELCERRLPALQANDSTPNKVNHQPRSLADSPRGRTCRFENVAE